MNAPRAALILLLAGSLLSACGNHPKARESQFLSLGTLVDVSLYGVSAERAHRLGQALQRQMDAFTHRWRPHGDGALGKINAALAAGETPAVPPRMASAMRQAQALSRASGGRFQPALGRLVTLWGFDQEERPPGPPPSPDAVHKLVAAHPDIANIRLDGDRIEGAGPALRLDFGAFAKGLAVDRAIDYLRKQGVKNAIVNAGGDLRAIGRHGDRPWRIGIRNPRGPGYIASVEVAGDRSVFTSGDYERYFVYQGKRYHHILDPATGYPSKGFTSVTVITGNAARGDAAATALMVAGPHHWRAVAQAMHVDRVMAVDSAGRVHLTDAMAKQIRFESDPAPEIAEQVP